MSASDGTIEFLSDILAPLGHISARRMFGGAGVYCDGVIFGLFLRDALYLKADASTIPAFEAEGMTPFSYATTSGERSLVSYWRVPERLYDEPDEFVLWARRALAVAGARPATKRKPKRKPAGV